MFFLKFLVYISQSWKITRKVRMTFYYMFITVAEMNASSLFSLNTNLNNIQKE